MTDEESPPEPASTPPFGDKSAALVLTMFQDFYRQEIAAEEDVHRTLPFFATALGLIIAALNYTASQLPDWANVVKMCGLPPMSGFDFRLVSCASPVLTAGALLALAAASGLTVLALLFSATRVRDYQRVGPEAVLLTRAMELHAFHLSRGLPPTEVDNVVAGRLREQLLSDYAKVIPTNRTRTSDRYRSRARAVLWLILSLSAAIFATILVIVTAKFGLLAKVTP
jgi:hypothetical protein